MSKAVTLKSPTPSAQVCRLSLVMSVLKVTLFSCVGDTSQLPLSRELLVQHLELVDEFLAYRCEHVPGRDGSIRLDADEELRDIGVTDCDQY